MGVSSVALATSTANAAGTLSASRIGMAIVSRVPIMGTNPWGWLAVTVIATGATLYLYFQMHGADDRIRLPLEYWLDMGVFGKKKLTTDINNPFRKYSGIRAFSNVADELNALRLVNSHFAPNIQLGGGGLMGYGVDTSFTYSELDNGGKVGIGVYIYQDKKWKLAYRVLRKKGTFKYKAVLPNTYFNHSRPQTFDAGEGKEEIRFKMRMYGQGGMGPNSNKKENQCSGVRVDVMYQPDEKSPNVQFTHREQFGGY